MTQDATLTRAIDHAKRLRGLRALKAAMMRRGVRQAQIAADLDVDPSLVTHVLAGRATSAAVLSAIRRALSRAARD